MNFSSRPSTTSTLDHNNEPPQGSHFTNSHFTHDSDRPEKQSIGNDIEKQSTIHEHAMIETQKKDDANVPEERSENSTSPPIIIDWEGPEDPSNPRNWSKKKKWAAVFVVSSYTFLSPLASSMMAPATQPIANEFGITNSVILSMTVSIFILAYSFGPLLFGPLSEIYGRARVLQLANLFFLVFNLVCGFAQSTSQFLAFRFLAGFGGSAPLAVGGAILGDCFTPEQRGQAVAIYSLAPVLGPAIGPVAGAWIAEKSNWRWVFWSTSIFCGAVQVVGLFALKETFHPMLLANKAQRVRAEMGIDLYDTTRVKTPYDTDDRHWQKIFAKALTRPFAMFFYEPIVQVFGLFMAFIYGLVYLVLVTIPDIFQITYHQSVGIAGLNYIALGIGLTGASQINARVMDRMYLYFKNKYGGVGRPEYRLPSMMVGVLCLPIGLFLTGWTAQKATSWVATDVGLVFVGAGMILVFQPAQTYIIDTFTLYAASALAIVAFLRSLAGFGFPLFAPAMYNALGYGKGNTVLAVVGIAIGWPAPILLWFYGERIREMSRHAKK